MGKRVMAALVAPGVVVAAIGGWAVGSFATSTAPTGTSLCIAASSSTTLPVLNSVNGTCPSGYSLVTVANNSDLVSLFNRVGTDELNISALQGKTVSRFTTNGQYTYPVPTGVAQLKVELWGGGGGGGTSAQVAGGSGGQGDYSHAVINVTGSGTGASCNVVVGAGGAGSSQAGTEAAAGGPSSVTCGQGPTVSAPGGGGGFAYNDNSGAGGTSPPGSESAAVQTFQGQPGGSSVPCVSPSAFVAGGGQGFPGAGGSALCTGAGGSGSPGLVLITPMG